MEQRDDVHGRLVEHVALDERALYLFDTRGFFTRSGFLTDAEVAGFIGALETRWPDAEDGIRRVDELAAFGEDFRRLAVRLAAEIGVYDVINQPFRLIESYALHRGAGSVFNFHNGFSNPVRSAYGKASRAMWRHHSYHDGKTYTMMVKVLVYLTDITEPDDAPFCFVEGSHKANYAFPMKRSEIKRGAALSFPSVTPVFPRAGEVLVLNEALMHGTFPKVSERPRIVMAFSYAPSFVTDYQKLPRTTADIWNSGFNE